MSQRDTPIEVKALTDELSALWREVAALAPKWAVPLTAVERAHRQLAQRDAALPATQRTARHRRECVEALQAQKRDVEAQLAQLHSTTFALTGLVSRHLTTTRGALGEAAAPVQQLQCELATPCEYLWILCVSLVAGFVTWLVMGEVSLPLSIVLTVCTGALSGIRFEFDGRSLRVSRRVLGVCCSPTRVVDLARFNQVDETRFDVHGKYAWTQHVRFELSGRGEQVSIGSRPLGHDSESIGQQLREWCVAAGVAAE